MADQTNPPADATPPEDNATQAPPPADAAPADPAGTATEAAAAPPEADPAATPAAGEPDPFAAPEFAEDSGDPECTNIDLLDDVELDVKIELGRTDMYIEEVLQLGVGSVVELNKLAGDPVDIYVNERLVARGEVLVLNDNFCVRINDIVSSIPEAETQD